MKFTVYTDAQAFADAVLPVLSQHEIQNDLIYHNIRGAIASEDTSGYWMATVQDAEGLVLLCAIRKLPMQMVMYEAGNVPNDAALACFVDGIIEDGTELTLVMTEKTLAKRLIDLYSTRTGTAFSLEESLVIYALDAVKPLTLPAGQFRLLGEKDMHFLPYWFGDFAPACGLGEFSLETGLNRAAYYTEKGTAYVWQDDMPVSMAACARTTEHCAFVSQVYTPPQFRGKGYAAACVWNLTKKLLSEGWPRCALYANCANPYSNRVYRKIGYQALCYFDKYQQIKA